MACVYNVLSSATSGLENAWMKQAFVVLPDILTSNFASLARALLLYNCEASCSWEFSHEQDADHPVCMATTLLGCMQEWIVRGD